MAGDRFIESLGPHERELFHQEVQNGLDELEWTLKQEQADQETANPEDFDVPEASGPDHIR